MITILWLQSCFVLFHDIVEMGEWAAARSRADTLIYDTVMHNRHCLMGALLSLSHTAATQYIQHYIAQPFALLSQFPLIYDEPCAALAGCWSCFSWCSSSSSQGVPGILTSKISLRNKESWGCKERKKKVKCTTFQIHLSVFLENHEVEKCFALKQNTREDWDSLFSQDLVQLS